MDLGGRFDIERELGRGAMATVYLALDRKHGRWVALKVLRPELRWPGAAERFHYEIQVAARLAHPNIVPLFDSGDADGTLYFVMQYVDGAETLRECLTREGALPLARAIAVASDVASALEYAHRQEVVHRDIKPENILLAEGRAMVLDFGIARALDARRTERTTEAGLVIGTPAYMSPEQAAGDAGIGPASDLYSLGCVLYEMLGGKPPFAGTTPQRVLLGHLQETPRPLSALRPDTPAAAQTLVSRLLEKDPEKRLQPASRVIEALQATVSSPRADRSSRVVLIVAALLMALLVVWAVRRPPTAAARAPAPDPADVAVLYLEVPDDTALRPVASGLTDALIDRLSKVEGLRVRSRDAMRPLRESGLPIDSVAARLGVGTLVTGTLSGSLAAPVLTIRLVNADGTQLDSRTVQAAASEPLALEGALVEQVADFLRQRLGREITLRARRQGTKSDRAWLLLQQGEESRGQGKELLQRGDTLAAARVLGEADSLFARAATEDPRWLDPLLARGRLATLQYDFLRAPERRAAAVAQGLVFARRALDQAPDQPEALELRGVLRSYAARLQPSLDTVALDAAIGDLRAGSTSDNPNQARALSSLSAVLLERGRWQEAQLAAQRAFEQDAFLEQADRVLNDLYHTSLYLGQWNEAAHWCETGRARFPANWLFSFCQLALELMPTDVAPQPERAWAMVRALDSLAPPADRTPGRWRMMVAAVLARAGQQDSARRTMHVARAMAPDDPEIDFYEAAARVQVGEQAAAIALLRRIVERDPELRVGLAQDPAFRPLAGNAEFDALVR